MKIKKLLILLVAVIITIALCVTVVAVLDIGGLKDNGKDTTAETDAAEKPNNPIIIGEALDDVVKERTVTIDGKEITVNYAKTQTIGGVRRDVYLDSDGNVYHFTPEGVFSAKYEANDNTVKDENEDSTKTFAEADYIKIAEEHMREVFGSDVAEYKYSEHYVSESSGEYSVYFARKIGKDGFVTAGTYSVSVSAEGGITACSRSTKDFFDGFDMSLLDEVSREDVTGFAESEIKRVFESFGITESEVSAGATLRYKEDKYVLNVSCEFVTEKPISAELIEDYNIFVALSGSEHRYNVTFAYELGA
jgi:hypothetical protein